MTTTLYRFFTSLPTLGIFGACRLVIAQLFAREFYIKPRGYPQPLIVRGRTSDTAVFYSIICRKSYPPLKHEPRFIIDAGANAGYASAYFAHLYPKAQIIALEPEDTNFEVLIRNIAGYGNVVPLRVALSSDGQDLFVEDASVEKWAYRFVKQPPLSLPQSRKMLHVQLQI